MMYLLKSFVIAADALTFAVEVLGWQPERWQSEVLRSKEKQIILNCFRQSGKSTVAAILALHQAIYYPGSLILLVSPSQRQSSELFRKVLDFMRGLPKEVVLLEDNKQSIMLENGSRIVSLPDNPERIRGFSDPSLIIIDEAALVSDETINALRPMRMRSKKRFLLLSTPFGKQGYFFRVWTRLGTDWKKVKITVDDVDYVDKKWLAGERKELGDIYFRQEFHGEFLSNEFSLFAYEDIVAALSDDIPPLLLRGGDGLEHINPYYLRASAEGERRSYFISIDLGKSKSRSAIAVIEKYVCEKNIEYRVIHLERYERHSQHLSVVERVTSLIGMGGPFSRAKIIVDYSGPGEVVYELLSHNGLRPGGVTITSHGKPGGEKGKIVTAPKDRMMTNAAAKLESEQILISKYLEHAYDLVQEMANIEIKLTKRGNQTYHAIGVDASDDLAIAMVTGIWYAEHGIRPRGRLTFVEIPRHRYGYPF